MEQIMSNVTATFLNMKNVIQLYHWQTKSFARHKASDDLLSKLSSKVDSFVETMQGKENKRVIISDSDLNLKLINANDNQIVDVLEKFRDWLKTTIQTFFANDKDLLNIRDDMLIDVNTTLYLFTFK